MPDWILALQVEVSRWLIYDRVRSRLLPRQREQAIVYVHHHWVVYWVTVVEYLVAFILMVARFDDVIKGWLPVVLALVLVAHGSWIAAEHYADVLVVTNIRMFRLRGLLARELATMPIDRILDITVKETGIGRLLGYAHFTFETAAQEQGLREVKFISRPWANDLEIETLVAEGGLRRRLG